MVELAERLRGRRGEIEQAILARVYGISDPNGISDPTYVDGLRAAISASIEYGVLAVQHNSDHQPPAPPALLVQARLAARNGVSVDTVLRRYLAGYTLFNDFLIEEAGREPAVHGVELQRLLRAQAAAFDRLVGSVTEEYTREVRTRPTTSTERRAQVVDRLLAGELVDAADLAYDLGANHLAVVAIGFGAEETIRALADLLERRLLLVPRSDGAIWAWLGGPRDIDPAEIERFLCERPVEDASIAVGEPAPGIYGWRLSHRQAAAAMPITQRGPTRHVRYADVAFLASGLRDDILTRSLHDLYADSIGDEGGGASARETLLVYFAAGHNVSSTSAALGVSRQTVNARLRSAEEGLGRPLDACAAEVEMAARLWELLFPNSQASQSD